MASAAASASPSLADVLRQLPVRGFTCRLHSDRASARLACRALRDAIDGGVTHAHLQLTPADAQHWRPGLLHERWPCCSSVAVTVVGVAGGARDEDAAALLALPFEGLSQSAAGATRITSVTLASRGAVLTGAEAGIALVAQRLPRLEELDLQGLDKADLSYEPEQLGRMWQALTAVSTLQVLRLLDFRALAGAKAVQSGGNVATLDVCIISGLTDSLLAQAAAGLSCLGGLRSLSIDNCRNVSAARCLSRILDNLPASLEKLTVFDLSGYDSMDFEMHLEHGLVTSVEQHAGSLSCVVPLGLVDFADAARLLLRSRALGPRLRALSLTCTFRDNSKPFDEEAVAPLRALVERTDVINMDVHVDHLSYETPLVQTVRLLGKPASMTFLEWPSHCLQIKGSRAAGVAAAGELPAAASLMQAAVRRVAAEAAAAAAAVSDASGAMAAAHHMLLLSAPVFGAMADDEVALRGFVGAICDGAHAHEARYLASRILQPDMLLLQLRTAEAAQSAAAVAALKASPDAVRALIWPAAHYGRNCVLWYVYKTVVEELQEVWAPRFANAAPSKEPALLRWLCDVLHAANILCGWPNRAADV